MAVQAAQGLRLASVRPLTTADALAFTTFIDTEVTRALVVNNTASPVAFRLYHVPAGGAAGLDNALFYDKSVAANDTFIFASDANNSGVQLKEGDTIVVRSATGGALGFQIYGVTASIAQGV